jgi:hypothetical protein
MDKHLALYEKGESFDILGKYMEGYDLDGTGIFNVDESDNSTVEKKRKTGNFAQRRASCFYRLC